MTLPLTNNPSETFSFNINGEIFKFKQLWNAMGFWTINISDANDTAIISGLKLITRENLLAMHPSITFDLRSERESDPTRNDLDQFELLILEKDNG